MPRFVREDETKEVHAPWWAEKETATIRRFNYGDRRWLAAQTVKFQIVGDQPIHEAQIERMNIAMIERGLVRWTDEEGKNLPKTPKQIGLLEPRDAEFILTEINAFNPDESRTPEAQDTFRDGSGNGADDGEQSTD